MPPLFFIAAAKTPVASGEIIQSGVVIVHPEIGPEGGRKLQLGICGLEGEKVAHPLLAAGADDQIHIRLAVRVQRLPEGILGDFRGIERA